MTRRVINRGRIFPQRPGRRFDKKWFVPLDLRLLTRDHPMFGKSREEQAAWEAKLVMDRLDKFFRRLNGARVVI